MAPIHRTSRLPVKEVVLGITEEKQISGRLTAAAGILLFLFSVILPRTVSGNMLYLMGGISLLGLIAAAIILIPLLTDRTAVVLERIYGIILGNEGKLAARNMRGNKNVIQNITLLFISISAVIAISVVGDFVTTYVSDVFRGAELQGFADGHMEPAFVEQVKGMDGVEKFSRSISWITGCRQKVSPWDVWRRRMTWTCTAPCLPSIIRKIQSSPGLPLLLGLNASSFSAKTV